MTYFSPILLLLIGLFLTNDYSIDLFNLQFRLIGSLLQLFGIAFLVIFFLKYPTLYETDWQDKIEEVYLITKNGLCIYYKSHIQKMDSIDEHLITGTITSVNIMLKKILRLGSGDISVIKKKGKLIYMFPSDLITGVIFSGRESNTIGLYIKQLVIKVEQVYTNILKNWDGDLEIFNPIKDIYQDIFST